MLGPITWFGLLRPLWTALADSTYTGGTTAFLPWCMAGSKRLVHLALRLLADVRNIESKALFARIANLGVSRSEWPLQVGL
jgi:hypothetical protein